MVNYSNCKIYKIEPICEHDEGDIYIGSTTKDYLSKRMVAHRSLYKRCKNSKEINYCSSYKLFDKYGIENCNIYLLENVSANSKDELLAQKREDVASKEVEALIVYLHHVSCVLLTTSLMRHL
jgi:hypothetical protein